MWSRDHRHHRSRRRRRERGRSWPGLWWLRDAHARCAVPAVIVRATALVAALVATGCCAYSSPGWRGAPSGHFDGERFTNMRTVPHRDIGDLLRWRASRDRGPWRRHPDARPGPAPPPRVARGAVRVTFVNHATTLVQLDGVNVLTDPVWSRQVGPIDGTGPERVRPPGIRLRDLPPLDAIVISHNHYDHLDVPTLRRLVRAHPRVRIFAGLGTAAFLREEGLPASTDLDWWQSRQLRGGVRVTAVPAVHLSGRGLCDQNATLWAGWVLEGAGGPVYFAGDTGMGEHFALIRRHFGPMRLALLPIGASEPRWFMWPMHIDPREAVAAHRILEARTSVAIHFGTFPQGDDGETEPVEHLHAAMARAGVGDDDFWVLDHGEGRDVP